MLTALHQTQRGASVASLSMTYLEHIVLLQNLDQAGGNFIRIAYQHLSSFPDLGLEHASNV